MMTKAAGKTTVKKVRRDFDDTEPRPWLRLWARGLDIFYHSFAAGLVWHSVDPAGFAQLNPVWMPLVLMLLWVVGESLYMLAFGTTPGKLLLRIRVRREGGERLSGAQVWQRSFWVWLLGMGAGVNILALIGNIAAYRKLRRDDVTFWDQRLGLTVSYGELGMLRAFLALALVAFMMIFVFFGLVV